MFQQRAGNGGGTGGIADAHIAAHKQSAPVIRGAGGGPVTTGQRLFKLAWCHRVGCGQIGGARCDLLITYIGQRRNVADGSEIHHFQRGSQFPSQHADSRTPAGKVRNHLGGDFLGVRGYALRTDAVIRRENSDADRVDLRMLRALKARQCNRYVFQLPQRPPGLGEHVLALPCPLAKMGVGGWQRLCPAGRQRHGWILRWQSVGSRRWSTRPEKVSRIAATRLDFLSITTTHRPLEETLLI